ncbi:MAG TPA: XRE family transcriptional regulator [Desulfobacteraceae bacterium]|nr:XRE family transcriptional regulator [Desulfobacteraceae bacterium]
MNQLIKNENTNESFGDLLRAFRKKNRISQLDLALDIDISSRHLSFVETGKSNPSRNLVLKIADNLKLPFRQRNALLLSAGYAPAFEELPFDGQRMGNVRDALQRLLDNHNPYPAFVVNTGYKILMKNRAYDHFIKFYAGEAALEKYDNAIRLLFAEDGLQPHVKNWPAIAHFLLIRLEEEAASTQNKELTELYHELSQRKEVQIPIDLEMDMNFPVMRLTLEKESTKASFFTTISTLGTPLDLTTQEIRIELLFPSDEVTKALSPLE